MIGIGLAFSGIILSWIIYRTSIAQPPSSEMPLPYHNVETGGYYHTKWWYEEVENQDLVTGDAVARLANDVALITGGNAGIGKGIAVELCKLGVGTVVITSRSLNRAKKTVTELVEDGICKKGQIQGMQVDLADLDSVHALANDFKSRFSKLNYFVENAGGVIIPGQYPGPHVNKEGFEALYAGNYLGHFLLLQLLLDLIESSHPARISLTSSIAHWGVTNNLTSLLPTKGWDARKSQENGTLIGAVEQYCNTKFLQIAMAFELQQRLGGNSHITITPTAPGFINTNIPSGNREKTMPPINPLGRSPKHGAETTLHALFSKSIEGKTGYFLQPYWSPLHQNLPLGPLGLSVLLWEWLFQRITWGCFMWLPHPKTHDLSFQKQLWEESLKVVGLGPPSSSV
ncbi:short-chain dehydrogenase/reductase SDR [Nitzschia inconspicua]|uniref:Short-chain dehydrogenase/reductase SDR n=1 Tax=Nitzschia inconspicua TaxID=303405 RepID=A0A9K3KZH4_9STRA|nr:short-chain dehydrogenase/reductase SDR [Nitzschia inconspicua]